MSISTPKVLELSHRPSLEALLTGLEADLPGWTWKAGDASMLLNHWHVLGVFAPNSTRILAFLAYRPCGDALEVGALATLPEARGEGLMSGLLRYLKSRLLLRGQEIWLEVSSANGAARRVYDALGFRVVGARPSYYRDGSTALLMTLGE